MYLASTEKPTPVPHNKINIASSNDFWSSIGRYEQLYTQVLSLSADLPAVITARMDGITSKFLIAENNSFFSWAFSVIFSVRENT